MEIKKEDSKVIVLIHILVKIEATDNKQEEYASFTTSRDSFLERLEIV